MAWYDFSENRSRRKHKSNAGNTDSYSRGKDDRAEHGAYDNGHNKKHSSKQNEKRDGYAADGRYPDPGGKSAAYDRFNTRGERSYRESGHNGRYTRAEQDNYTAKSHAHTDRRFAGRNPDKAGRPYHGAGPEHTRQSSKYAHGHDEPGNAKRTVQKSNTTAHTAKYPKPGYLDYEYIPRSSVSSVQRDVNSTPENIISGRNPIREALKAGRDLEKLMVQSGELSGSAGEIARLAREAHIPVQYVDKQALDALAAHHQGMIAFASAYAYSSIEDILSAAQAKNEEPFLILLDGITDPHNLGAIIRTAECVGAHGVIIPEHRSVGLTPAAVKASAGAVEHIPVVRVPNLHHTISDLKALNIWSYAVTMDGEDYRKPDYSGGTALVIGAEGDGLSKLTKDLCDFSVSIPVLGNIDSLNASVAAGVVMYHVLSRKGR